MTIKVYTSGICGSQEVRKQQQRVLFILQSMPIDLQVIDVTEPDREEDRTFMQEECKKHDKKDPLPPQIFHDNEYCGDYGDFQLANDDDEVLRFLRLESLADKIASEQNAKDVAITNGVTNHEEMQSENIEVSEELQNNVTAEEATTGAVTDTNPNIEESVVQQQAPSEPPQEEQGKEESSEEEESEEEESE